MVQGKIKPEELTKHLSNRDGSYELTQSQLLIWEVMDEVAPISQIFSGSVKKNDIALAFIAYEMKYASAHEKAEDIFHTYHCLLKAADLNGYGYVKRLIREEEYDELYGFV